MTKKYSERIFKSVPPTGIRKYPKLIDIIKNIDINEIKLIIDCGGTDYTYRFLEDRFPHSEIISINLDKSQISETKKSIVGNVEELPNYFNKDSVDLIFFCDTLEHLSFPHKFIDGAKHILKKNGYIIITTPNLASIFNRLFLLFGFSPSNYHPYIGPIVGNPIMKGRHGGSHRSVFTLKGLKQWLILNRFEILGCEGFDYGNEEIEFREGRFSKTRKIVDFITPIGCKEGIVILCKKL